MLDIEVVAQAPQAEDRPPVPGFSGWWDASDPVTIQGGLGDSVATWRDKSGFARHLTQATDANRPVTGSWTQNGRNLVWAISRQAVLAGPVPLTTQPFTMFIAAANAATDGVQRTVVTGFGGSGVEWGRIYRPTSNPVSMYAGAVMSSSQLWELRRPRVVAATFNGASSSLRVDGRYVTPGSQGGNGNSAQQSVFGLGINESWYGWIGELIYYDARTLTAGELGRIESYLMRKWGIA
jgi:hypothetical protein